MSSSQADHKDGITPVPGPGTKPPQPPSESPSENDGVCLSDTVKSEKIRNMYRILLAVSFAMMSICFLAAALTGTIATTFCMGNDPACWTFAAPFWFSVLGLICAGGVCAIWFGAMILVRSSAWSRGTEVRQLHPEHSA